MKIVTFVKPNERNPPPLWADLVIKLNVNSVYDALPSVLGQPDDVLLLHNYVKVIDKDAVVKFFSSFKSSAIVKYGDKEIGYFLSARDKNMNSRLVITHYALKV